MEKTKTKSNGTSLTQMVVFSDKLSQRDKQKVIDQTLLHKVISAKKWEISDWTDQQIKAAFKNIRKASIQQLELTKGSHIQIVKSISHIQFLNLEDLTLQNTHTGSVQRLGSMELPSLINLTLSGNELTSIAALSRLQSPRLKWLFLRMNYIQDFCPLIMGRFPRLNTIWLSQSYDPPTHCYDLQNFAKIKGRKITDFKISSNYLPNQQRIKAFYSK